MKTPAWVGRTLNSRALTGVGIATVVAGGIAMAATQTMAASFSGLPYNDFNALEQEIQNLQARVSTLESQVRALQNGGVYTPPPFFVPAPTPAPYVVPQPYVPPMQPVALPQVGPVVIDQNGGTFNPGFHIYFTGRGFAPYEQIIITRNGYLVASDGTDAAGGFAAPGILLTEGVQTFVFTGQQSGARAVASVTGRNI